jgi:hypothetical protein
MVQMHSEQENNAPKVVKESQGESPPKVHISALFGSLKDKTTVRATIEEINEAIAEGWAGV